MSDNDKLIEMVCKGNKDAENFLRTYLGLAHQIDDIIDLESVTNEFILRVFLSTITLFGLNKFYCDNRDFIYPLVVISLNCYSTSVAWENSEQDHHKRIADILRAGSNNVIMFVALVCGGLEHMREATPLILELSWKMHHDKDGNPV